GDNIGYWLGREVGRRRLYRYAWLTRLADRVIPTAERCCARHGGKPVFLARFFGCVRVTGAWRAGITRMPWGRFLFWSAACRNPRTWSWSSARTRQRERSSAAAPRRRSTRTRDAT